ncbi:class I SAM-dependent methyltransferase [Paraburkholderia sp. CNPSo 3274]|uniref:class I SAM-dependent methyltransferase n=1 Tax=Paraburkholderia sp. CNPSo 3274 TaxID=2940932 RepID=UPI0020B7B0AD|nr:class I SAM-dependent methyltransferase [Paraburkholderia sp. CNPSo 3274]MCP3712734.1 class I SAM-dependent methyltransferase [Paraburkholderia sp. CNPSo 3274]
MDQTPVHQNHNPDLLKLMPSGARRVVEVGCSSGALAREYKKSNPAVHYTGIEIVPAYAEMAREHCDRVTDVDIERVPIEQLRTDFEADCWVFGDVLEHLYDPWALLKKLRESIGRGGCVVACIPNAQHWSVQARLSIGDFRYQDSGLFDRTHIRWFSRVTMLEMFRNAGFVVDAGKARVFNEPQREAFLPVIRAMATAAGADANVAVEDSKALQYVFRASVV